MLRPILDLVRRHECTYRWGYPLAVRSCKAQSPFTIRSPTELPAFFVFLGADPVQVQNWLQIIPHLPGRSGPNANRNNQPACTQISKWRSRVPSMNRSREP